MQVRVLYFAAARELAGNSREEVTVREGTKVEGLAEELMKLHPGLKPVLRSVRFSVNHEVVEDSARLREGDEVGVLPPVAGG